MQPAETWLERYWWPHYLNKPTKGKYRRIRPHAMHPLKRPGKRRLRRV